MDFKYFSKNGVALPLAEAVVPLSNIEYQYGFGVYENVRVVRGRPLFLDDHVERLEESARIIGLEHPFESTAIHHSVDELIAKNEIDTANLKLLLLGGRSEAEASLFILPLNPLFPDKKIYRDGVLLVSHQYERLFPHAKTLNMLGSFLAYRKAKAADAYDALLIDRQGFVTEGTRTNFFALKGKTIYSPPESEILLGVTRKYVLEAAHRSGFALEERKITLADLKEYDAAFITSTSSKILPVRQIDDASVDVSAPALRELMTAFDDFLQKTT
ncbi:MAG: aminotransferase class IV [Candidatus Kaiserbacteria bacterium]|nr:MAG: aminotransferase class IV [Candidatus Kaiserbacteria bacterium]